MGLLRAVLRLAGRHGGKGLDDLALAEPPVRADVNIFGLPILLVKKTTLRTTSGLRPQEGL